MHAKPENKQSENGARAMSGHYPAILLILIMRRGVLE